MTDGSFIYAKPPRGFRDYAGIKVGGFRFLGFHEQYKGLAWWWVQCLTCKEVYSRYAAEFVRTETKCCMACYRKGEQSGTIHGMSDTDVYSAWLAGKAAGGFCSKWRHDFYAFFSYMGHRPEGKKIHKLDPKKQHGPGNSIWASHDDVVELNILKVEAYRGPLSAERRGQLKEVSRQRLHGMLKNEIRKLEPRDIRRIPRRGWMPGWVHKSGLLEKIWTRTIKVTLDGGFKPSRFVPRSGLRQIMYEDGATEVMHPTMRNRDGLRAGERFSALKVTLNLAYKMGWSKHQWVRCPSTYYWRS